jgi:hypothetical protein
MRKLLAQETFVDLAVTLHKSGYMIGVGRPPRITTNPTGDAGQIIAAEWIVVYESSIEWSWSKEHPFRTSTLVIRQIADVMIEWGWNSGPQIVMEVYDKSMVTRLDSAIDHCPLVVIEDLPDPQRVKRFSLNNTTNRWSLVK